MGNANYKHILTHFKKRDHKLHKYMLTVDFDEWLKFDQRATTKDAYFTALCREIIGQQLSGKAANTIYSRFLTLFKSKKVTPKKILELEDQQLRDVGMSWAKAKYVKDLATKVESGELKLEALSGLEDAQVTKELTNVKGIGNWTAEMFLLFTLKREDIFSYGDLGLRKGIEKVYEVEDSDDLKIEKIVSKWSPYKSYGSITLWHALDSKNVEIAL